ncbi:hypothetical protein [Cytophaga aurantiaca]|uniref:hypothetical protein n=1 Tax=Cytophaga aurantiaca TaxID=29530 RepID=UPI00036FB03C|nr:hypothetical protein [Cytophaga aurantiaca]
MKHTLIILIFSFLSFIVTGKPKVDLSTNKHIKELSDSLAMLKKINADLSIVKDEKLALLQQRLNQASDTIANQNAFVTSFGVIYTILTIIIALLAIGIPLISYFWGIKPSHDFINEVNKTIDLKIVESIQESNARQFEKAIEQLNHGNSDEKNAANRYFQTNHNMELTNQQAFDIVHILDNVKNNTSTISLLNKIIGNVETDYATKYFDRSLNDTNKSQQQKQDAIVYLIKSGTIKNIVKLRKAGKAIKGGVINTITWTSIWRHAEVIPLLNDKEMMDLVDSNSLEQINLNPTHFMETWQLSKEDFEKTYLYTRVLTIQ